MEIRQAKIIDKLTRTQSAHDLRIATGIETGNFYQALERLEKSGDVIFEFKHEIMMVKRIKQKWARN